MTPTCWWQEPRFVPPSSVRGASGNRPSHESSIREPAPKHQFPSRLSPFHARHVAHGLLTLKVTRSPAIDQCDTAPEAGATAERLSQLPRISGFFPLQICLMIKPRGWNPSSRPKPQIILPFRSLICRIFALRSATNVVTLAMRFCVNRKSSFQSPWVRVTPCLRLGLSRYCQSLLTETPRPCV